MSTPKDGTPGSHRHTALAMRGKGSRASHDAVSLRSRFVAAMRACLPPNQATSGDPGSKTQSFPLPGFTHMDFYLQDLQICGFASIKLALANCSKSSNKSNANPHPPSYCRCQAPVTTICGKILLTSPLACVSSSASVKTAP